MRLADAMCTRSAYFADCDVYCIRVTLGPSQTPRYSAAPKMLNFAYSGMFAITKSRITLIKCRDKDFETGTILHLAVFNLRHAQRPAIKKFYIVQGDGPSFVGQLLCHQRRGGHNQF